MCFRTISTRLLKFSKTNIFFQYYNFYFILLSDKERDVEAQSQRLTTELKNEKLKQTELRNEIQNLQTQLSEAKNGLLAASRISDQLEMSQITITTLKNECK